MNTKYLFCFVILSVILIILILNKYSSEEFSEYKMSAEEINDMTKLYTDFSNKNIFVGDKNSDKINPYSNLSTNNTIFIKDGIELKNDSGESVYLNMESLKNMKYIPYNFKEKMCIGNSCVNKTHLKMIKGDIPFKMNTFFTTSPYQIFGGVNFSRIKRAIGATRGYSRISFPIKSVRITEPGYHLIIYTEPGYRGQSYTIKQSNNNIPGIVIDGNRPFSNGAKSCLPVLESGKEHAKNACFSLERPFQIPWFGYVYQARDCDSTLLRHGNEFYILRPDLLGDHSHEEGDPAIHFHDHPNAEKLHGGSHEH